MKLENIFYKNGISKEKLEKALLKAAREERERAEEAMKHLPKVA